MRNFVKYVWKRGLALGFGVIVSPMFGLLSLIVIFKMIASSIKLIFKRFGYKEYRTVGLIFTRSFVVRVHYLCLKLTEKKFFGRCV